MRSLLPLLCFVAFDARALDLAPCGDFRCGTLSVPENHEQPDGRKLALKVVIVPAVQRDASMPPLIDFAGGPGIAVTGGADFFATIGAAHRQKRDVVLMDQRGTADDHELACSEVVQADPLDGILPVTLVKQCRGRLAKSHDLSRYGTGDAARDVEALRVALGAEQFDISSISYGTRLAQHYLRAYPQRVRSAVLIGTVPDDAKIPLGYARAAQDVLDRVLPRALADEWAGVLAKVDAGEAVVDRNGRKVTLRRAEFAEAVRSRLGSTTSQRAVPAQVESLSRGEFQAFADTVEPDGTFALGLYLSVVCPEDAAHITDADIEPATRETFLGAGRVEAQRAACKAWDVPAVTPIAKPFPKVPTLLLAGGNDHVTPTAYAKAVAAKMPHAQVVEVPGLGHMPEGLSNMACYDAMIAAFFNDPSKPVDPSCVATMK